MNKPEYIEAGYRLGFGLHRHYTIDGDKLKLVCSSWLLGNRPSFEFPLKQINPDFKKLTVQNWAKLKWIFVFLIFSSLAVFTWYMNRTHFWEFPWLGEYVIGPNVLCAAMIPVIIVSLVVGIVAQGSHTSAYFRTEAAGVVIELSKHGKHQGDFDAFLETLLLAIREARNKDES